MTRDELIETATQVYGKSDWHESALFHLESFAKLVAAKRQEDIIQIIKETPFSNWFQADVIEAIKARGEQA